MDKIIQTALEFMSSNGYFAIAVGTALASAGMPLPSELTLGFAGYLIFSHRLEFIPVLIAAVLGELIGSILSYVVGYYCSVATAQKYNKYTVALACKSASMQYWLKRYGLAMVFFGRILPVIRGMIPLPAGWMQIDFTKYVICIVFSSTIWSIILLYAGMFFGENWRQIYSMVSAIGNMLVIIGFTLAFFYFIKWLRRNYQ